MKKIYFIAVLLIITTASYACDICGCGGGNFYMGLLPHFKSKFIGVRYHYMNYNTQLTSDPTQFSKNYYNTIELWGGMNIGRRWQLLGFVPYHINKQIDDDGITHTNGLGDITLLANYQLLHKLRRREHTGIEQQLWIGGGVKLPTGAFNADLKNPNITVRDVNAQLGTGSVDLILNTIYNIRFRNWGINTTVSYKANTDKGSYHFGNKFTANSIAYYTVATTKGISVMPNVGIMYEDTRSNTLNKAIIASTGGYIATASAGVETGFQHFTVGLNFQAPFSQHYADGQTRLNWRGNLHISVPF